MKTNPPKSEEIIARKNRLSEKFFSLQVSLHVDVANKARIGRKIILAKICGVSHLRVMPDQPSPDKRMIAVRIARAAYARLEKAAKLHKMTLADFLRYLIQKATDGIELTDKDYEKIAADIRAYHNRKTGRGSVRKTGKTGA